MNPGLLVKGSQAKNKVYLNSTFHRHESQSALQEQVQEYANTLINSSHPYTVHLWNNTLVLFFLHRWPPLLSRSLHRPLRCYEHNPSHLWHPGNGPTRLKREEDGSALLTRCHTREIEQGRGGGDIRSWGHLSPQNNFASAQLTARQSFALSQPCNRTDDNLQPAS